jgi:hypothetical protein
VVALELGISLLKELPLCGRLIRELHENADGGCERTARNSRHVSNDAELDRQAR